MTRRVSVPVRDPHRALALAVIAQAVREGAVSVPWCSTVRESTGSRLRGAPSTSVAAL